MHDRDPHRTDAGELHLGLLDPIHAAHGLEGRAPGLVVDPRHRAHRAHGGLHHAPGRAEERPGPGRRAHEGRVVRDFGHLREVDPGAAQHRREFAGGEHEVRVLHARFADERGSRGLLLLRGAGHDRDGADRLGIEPLLLREVGLRQGAEDRLGASGGGKIRDQFRGGEFDVVHPTRAAGREVGPPTAGLTVGLQFPENLRPLLHDRHVGGPARVHHEVDAQGFQRRRDAAFDVGPGREPEGFAQLDPHRRRRLHDGRHHRIFDPVEKHVALILFRQRPRRAHQRALPAGDAAAALGPLHADRPEADRGRGPHAVQGERALPRHLAAGFDAAQAPHAPAPVKDQCPAGVVIAPLRRLRAEVDARGGAKPQAHPRGLQFARPMARAARAVLAVVGHQEFQLELLHPADLRGLGFDPPARAQHRVAGGRDERVALHGRHLHQAHAAGSRAVPHFREFAERLDEDALAARGFQNRFALAERHLAPVDHRAEVRRPVVFIRHRRLSLHCFIHHVLRHQSASSSDLPGIGRSVAAAKSR